MTARTYIRRGQSLAAAIYAAGLAYWIFFFNVGSFTLNNNDWYKEAHYLDTLRAALLSGRVPLTWNEPWYHETVRFLAIPEIVLTPDIALLAILDNGPFALIHTALLYTLGFAGMLGLARRMELGWLAVGFFWIVFNLNGHLASHLGIGHFQWTGYLLFPLVMHLSLRCLSSSPSSVGAGPIDAPAMLALVVGLLFLNGSFHIAIWCIAVILVTCGSDWNGFRRATWAVAMGLILSLGRIAPAAWDFEASTGKPIFSGYPSLGIFFDALLHPRGYDNQTIGFLNWWEYNLYLGYAGAAAVAGFAAVALFDPKRRLPIVTLAIAATFAFLAVGPIYPWLVSLHLPLIRIERVPSRFVIVTLTIIALWAASGVDYLHRVYPRWLSIAAMLVLPIMLYEMLAHAAMWQAAMIELPAGQSIKLGLHIVENHDLRYAIVVLTSWLASIAGLAFVLGYRRPDGPPRSTIASS